MKIIRVVPLLFAISSILNAADIVEVSATLVPVTHPDASNLSQLELHQQVQIARSRGAEDLLKLSSVIESGKWATIKRGREFFYPGEYSEAKVYRAASDSGKYSIPEAGIAPGNHSLILPSFPSSTSRTEIGASLQVRPTVKEDGVIYLEGKFKDTVFEGLSEEAIPVTVETSQMIRQNRVHPIMSSRIDKAVFRKVEKDFGVMLPDSPGTSANAKLLRNAKTTYTYFLPVVLGNTAFGAPGKIEMQNSEAPTGPIRSTMMKATMVRDFFIKPKTEEKAAEQGILILDVKKIENPEPVPSPNSKRRIYLKSRFIESSVPPSLKVPVMSGDTFNGIVGDLTMKQGSDLLSAPSVVLDSGTTGKVELVREFIFPTRYIAPALETVNTGNKFPVTPPVPDVFESRNIGVSLNVGATLEANDMIRLKVKSSVVAFEGFIDFGNPVMAVKSGMIKKLKPNVVHESTVEMPIFPFRNTETELVVPNGSYVAVTMIFDYHNENHQKERLLKIRKAKVEEVKTPRYLTVFLSPTTIPE
ncbi:MAG: hypothetical protein P1V20_16965 [Verrucomicrobiales bacterium]|nr:hypothetical protein [Verrucomicrobiales bacterium]